MIPSNFTKLDNTVFFRKVWPKIKNKVEAIESNWNEVRKCKKVGLPSPPIVIHWGYRDKATGNKTTLVISYSDGINQDEHWVAPVLINELRIK